MTDLSNNTVVGLTLESVAGTFNAPSSSVDLLTVSNLRPSIQGQTSQTNEYTGSIHKKGDQVGGKTFEISGTCLLRGPGGTVPPAADGFVAGRLLRAIGFAETILSASVPAGGAEALGGSGNTPSVAALGSTAVATNDIYTGLAIQLASLGTIGQLPSLSMIADYLAAGKLASIAHTHSGNYSGNYLIPKQVAYILSSAAPPTLSASCWIGSKRYDGVGLSLSAFSINVPTFNRDNTELPSIDFTLTGDLQGDADDTCPTIDTSRAVPPFRNGRLDIDGIPLGGSSLKLDFGAQVAYPPNPNKATGSESSVLTETTRKLNFTLNHVSKATFDFIGKADAQAYHAVQAVWGLAAGNAMGLVVPKARFNYPSPDNGSALVNMTGEMLIDDSDLSVALAFPYY